MPALQTPIGGYAQGQRDLPVAYAKPIAAQILDRQALTSLTKPFVGQTIGQLYLGPAWVNDAGVACVVMLAPDDRGPRRLRQEGECILIAWRWNVAPSVPFSLTMGFRPDTPRPHVRWMRPSDDPVVRAIYREGRLLMAVANPQGQSSGWFDAVFKEGSLDQLWKSIPTPGIPYSKLNERFDPRRRFGGKLRESDEGKDVQRESDEGEDIPLWQEPVSDFWKTLDSKGPWSEDLTQHDRAIAAWGYRAWHARHIAAGAVQVMVDAQHLDKKTPLFDTDGLLFSDGTLQAKAHHLVTKFPLIERILSSLAGAEPNAQQAHEAAVALLHDPPSCFAVIVGLFELVGAIDHEALSTAVQACIDAALLDWRLTHTGTCRPWLANDGPGRLQLKALPIDLSASLRDIENLWRDGVELIELIEAGKRLAQSDFPVPLETVWVSLTSVAIETSVQDGEERVYALLQEAQEARCWSIPWGARVEVRFGPFVAVRIFELEGEFSCHFLDDQDRYFLVAIGLAQNPPQIATHRILRVPKGDEEPDWNLDGEVSLKLIAAAIVRDFLVVEDRTSLFGIQPLRRRVRGKDLRTVIYLPRVRYTTPHPERMPVDDAIVSRVRHSVAAHLRRAVNSSAAQRFLAQRYGVHIPAGFTFVRPHERGLAADAERIRVYRSRSASRMIFDVVDRAPAGSRPAWFDFEKDCARLLACRGMQVIHQAAHRDGDGGVDLFATDRGGQSWVVQCKCWAANRTVGPDVLRELEGAIRLADRGAVGQTSKGMVITTSAFTSGAVAAAAELGFELVDGGRLVQLLAE